MWDAHNTVFGSCTKRTYQGNDFELFIVVKIVTRHRVEGYFSSELPAICNHCGVMPAWNGKMLKFCTKFLRFFKNDPLRYNFQNSVRKVFIATPIDVLCSNFVKFVRREIGEIVRYLPDKKKNKISPGSHAEATARIYQNLPPTMYSECSRFHPNRFTFGGVIAERVNTAQTRRKVNPIFYWSLHVSSSRIIMVSVMRRWNFVKKILSFLKNDPLRYNFQNSLSKVFIATPIDVLCSNFVKFVRTGNRWNRALSTRQKFRLALRLKLLRGSTRASLRHCNCELDFSMQRRAQSQGGGAVLGLSSPLTMRCTA